MSASKFKLEITPLPRYPIPFEVQLMSDDDTTLIERVTLSTATSDHDIRSLVRGWVRDHTDLTKVEGESFALEIAEARSKIGM